MPNIQIKTASTKTDFAAIQDLFREYAESLPFDLAYQNFEGEMAAFPGKYAEPQGCLLVVEVDGAPMGAVGLRPLETGVAEIKRLYVRPGTRGLGLGRLLVAEIVARGRSIGYRTLRLDTIRGLMVGAERLYQGVGFVEIPPYYDSPIEGAVYYELRLT
ncbi:MAG: GNAT family N-acetyltransferase [Alphaproteobacteria bacterium]|jgi:putative acetyltransferase|nr:GNAT family N-acetyltransferase [Alphaproteobacteria bacterium]